MSGRGLAVVAIFIALGGTAMATQVADQPGATTAKKKGKRGPRGPTGPPRRTWCGRAAGSAGFARSIGSHRCDGHDRCHGSEGCHGQHGAVGAGRTNRSDGTRG